MLLCWMVGILGVLLGWMVVRRKAARHLPVWSLLAAAAGGAAALPPAGALEDVLVRVTGPLPHAGTVAWAAGLIEETAKLAVALGVGAALRGRRADPGRGVLLGSLAGLGMAALESAAYHHRWLAEGWGFLPRQIPRLYAHMVLGGIAAWGARPGGWSSTLPVLRALGALFAAAAMHGLLDWFSLDPARFEGFPGAPNSLQAVLVAACTGLYAWMLSSGFPSLSRETAGVDGARPESGDR